MKRKRALAASVACGIACAVCVIAYTQGVRGEVEQARADALARYGGDQVEVCVAKRDIAAGETIDAASVETKLWVSDLLPPDAIRASNEVVGSKASSVILSGEVLSARRFRSDSPSIEIPAGMTAISVPAKDVQAVGGAVSVGSRVDIYATGSSSTQALVRGVQVLATSAGSAASASSSDAKVSWVTVAVPDEQVQELVASAQKNDLYLTIPAAVAVGE